MSKKRNYEYGFKDGRQEAIKEFRKKVKEFKVFLNSYRKGINDLFDINGEFPDERMMAHLHTCINNVEDGFKKIFANFEDSTKKEVKEDDLL